MSYAGRIILAAAAAVGLVGAAMAQDGERARARDLGAAPGVLPTGLLNAITDVEGVRVGHVTLTEGETIRTGVTAVLPHGGDLYMDKVPAAVAVGNGFGKLMGVTQIRELGEIETPVILTNTLSVPAGAEGVIGWTLDQEGHEGIVSVNAVVGETNDSRLNDIRARAVTPDHVREAIETAAAGPVAEGAVGAGTGTVAFGWKGGIGTSSRALPASLGGYTVGVLVQSNFGGVLSIDGVKAGEALGQYYLKEQLDSDRADGSIMIVVATDAPLDDRNLERLAHRALAGLARTGASMTNGSGDYVIAFSTAEPVRRTPARRQGVESYAKLGNDRVSPLFQAVIEATEEAILNSLFMAESVTGYDSAAREARHIEAIPLDKVRALIEARNGQAKTEDE
ncbi:MAG: P1 family peptidase [Euryhalocaulis sp.]|uniref:DmpA family aminopeptidase n=1 Tax=Euryhalocaulis sp. TaxID=2744307 RepID=UPI0018231314|nr:P1 family peptidase [Euryhalocaulis sp.]MBA4800880.1 P1 family peptidase [Euryhalocaulis sp.]